MDGREDLDSFLGKWRQRWPEWRVAEAFLPPGLRDTATAWRSLRQEFADAAWAGADPRPGEAKLGWWVEELQGWSKGAHRHPLGRVLQARDAPWARLGAALPALADSRARATDFEEARSHLHGYARALADVSAALEPASSHDHDAFAGTLANAVIAQRLLDGDPGSVPLQANAQLGPEAGEPRLRAHAAALLLEDWTWPDGLPRAERIHLALLRARLRALRDGHPGSRALAGWRTLWLAWRAARHSVPPA